MHLSGIHVLLMLGTIASNLRPSLGQAAPANCTTADLKKQFCSDCKTPSICETAGEAPVLRPQCSKTGEACTVLLGKFAVCKAAVDTPCVCGNKPSQCDAYDPTSVFVCLSGGVTTVTKCKTAAKPDGTCINSVCGTEPPKSTTPSLADICKEFGGAGFVPLIPECSSATYCEDGRSLGSTDPCKDGEYFDVDELECLPAPPQPCPVSCGTGACSDKSDCSKWYICDAGTLLDEEICEGAFPEFDSKSLECVADDQGSCPMNEGCKFDLITTTVPSTPTTTKPTTTSTITPTTTSTTTPTTTRTTTPTTTSTTTPTTTRTTTPTTTRTTTPTTTTTSTSTTRPPTTIYPSTCGAANVGNRYPVAGNCKQYTSCRLVGTNVYAYVTTTCLGSLVFNAKTSNCDTLANVPGCVPPS